MNGYAPVTWLLAPTCFVLLFDLYRPGRRSWSFVLSLIALAGTFFCYFMLFQQNVTITADDNLHFLMNPWVSKLSLLILALSIFVLLHSQFSLVQQTVPVIEYSTLFLFSVGGLLVLVSAGSLLSLYLGLELMSLPLYAMVALSPHVARSDEAAMKYFILGVLASGFILYGFSLCYGITGEINLQQIANKTLNVSPDVAPVVLLGSVLVLAGLAFKFGLAPFHMWLPDVYEGAPPVVTLFLATVPKLAVFAFLFKILTVWPVTEPLRAQLSDVILWLGVFSSGVGNLFALLQRSLRRLLAYSTVAHAGFLFLGLVCWYSHGADSEFENVAPFYVITYVLMALSAFALILYLSDHHQLNTIDDLKGFSRREPLVAFLILLTFFSLAGIPPLLGFYAKFYVIQALMSLDHVTPAILVLIFSVIGAFYYLKVIWMIYFVEPERPYSPPLTLSSDQVPERPYLVQYGLLAIQSIALLIFGLAPVCLFQLLSPVLS